MARIFAILSVFVVFAVIAFVALMLLWAWIVPDVFSGAVKAGLLPESLTFVQALKLSVLIGFLFGSFGSSKKS